MTTWGTFAFDPFKALQALQKVLTGAKCPISVDQDWTIAPGYVEIRPSPAFPNMAFPATSGKVGISSNGYEIVAGSGWRAETQDAAYPTVMATCKQCGYVALFNAVALGLVPSGEPEKEGGREATREPRNG